MIISDISASAGFFVSRGVENVIVKEEKNILQTIESVRIMVNKLSDPYINRCRLGRRGELFNGRVRPTSAL